VQVDYQPFIDRVIRNYEGHYGWNKKDPGGPTNFGITCYDLAEHRHKKMDSMSRWAPLVAAMPLSEAEDIYRTKYAVGIAFDSAAPGIDCCTLDYAINSGVSRAVRVETAILKKYPGIKSLDFVNRMCDERLAFMHAIRGGSAWAEFGHGWAARVTDLRNYCIALASATITPNAPDLTKVAQPKAIHVPQTAGPVTGGATAGGAIAAHAAGFNWEVAAAVGAGVLALGIAYEAWQAGRTATANATVHL